MKNILLIFVLSFSANVYAGYTFSKEQGSLSFKAKGWPNLIKINGKGEGATGKLVFDENKLSGEMSFNLKSLKTGIDLRDRHLKEKYLKVNEPGKGTAVLKLDKITIPKKLKGKKKIKARLLLNEVEQDVEISAKFKPVKEGFKINAKFELSLSDFKIEIPSFKGITVAEEVAITVDLIAKGDSKE